jgi:hypothetical protein
MPTKPLDRLIFTQGGLCFFCKEPLLQSEASVEHLVATANGGGNGGDNCVACCKALNALFGSMSLKEKMQLVLNQNGHFRCPNKAVSKPVSEEVARIIADLQRRGPARPRTLKTLSSTIRALFQKRKSEQEVSSLIERLRTDGVIAVARTKVSYDLPI